MAQGNAEQLTLANSAKRVMTNLKSWRLEDAMTELAPLLYASPDSPLLWDLNARVLHQLGRHVEADAIFTYLSATHTKYSGGEVALRAAGSADYSAFFESIESDHFIFRFHGKDKIVAHYAVAVLEAAYKRIGQSLDFYPAERGIKIVVEIYPDARGLAQATGLTVREIATSGTIAVCKFHRLMITSPLATTAGYGWADTLAHEYIHLIVSKSSRNGIPIWLHEGIAKYYESRWQGKAGEALSPYSEKLLAEATQKEEWISFSKMHPSMAKLPSQEEAALAFAEVFSTIEMISKKQGDSAISRLLKTVGAGVPVEKALHKIWGMNIKKVELALHRYLKQRKFHLVPGAVGKKIILKSGQNKGKESSTGGGIDAITDRADHDYARLGELLQLRGHKKAALMEYKKIPKPWRYPSLIPLIAKGYMAVGEDAAALTLLTEALRLQPNVGDSNLLAGRIALKQGRINKAKKYFQRALQQNPFTPEVHQSLAKIYLQKGDKAKAIIEDNFFAISQKPRIQRLFQQPERPEQPSIEDSTCILTVVSRDYGLLRIDAGDPMPAPLWRYPLIAGEHLIEAIATSKKFSGKVDVKSVTCKAGELLTVRID